MPRAKKSACATSFAPSGASSNTIFSDVNETPNALTVSEDFEFGALSLADNYRKALLREFSAPLHGNVLEVGAGIGQLTEELLKKHYILRLVSIEPHLNFYRQLMEKFPEHKIIHGTFQDAHASDDWDAILSINVLEHIEDDESELKNYFHCLAKNIGTLCLFVPARPEIYSSIDKDFGHYRRYTKRELRDKLERAGFQVLRLRYYNIAGYFAWWLNFCVLKRRHFKGSSVRFFDRFIFPWVYKFESRVCAPPLGQSLLVEARAQ
jgi:SAM-dependent methyltransferase